MSSGGARTLGPRVFLISASLLAFEIILLRLFAVETFHHFAYMAIGVALLGFGASGTVLVLARRRVEGREDVLFRALCAVLPLAMLAAPSLGHLLEFEPTQFLWDWRPWLALTVLYGCLAIPFFIGATAITLALMSAGSAVGRIYAWNMVGSGLGGVLGVALLFPLAPHDALAASVLPALPPAVAGLLGPRRPAPGKGSRGPSAWVAAVLLCVAVSLAVARPPWTPRITPFKGLPQVEAFPDAERVGERWSPTGWVTAVRAPAFHHAPGLSLAYTGVLPDQVALFVDGETAGAATLWGGDPERVAFLDWLPSSAPYAVGAPRSVLVLGSGDGLQVLNALSHGAERVTAVELVGPLVELADAVADERSRVYSDPRVRSVIADARAFAARTDERFDLVVLSASGTFAAGASGIHGTGESYLETVEAYRSFLSLLEPGGTLAVTRWLRTPPRDNVKLVLTVEAALRASGVERPGDAVAFLRSWATGTLLARPAGFEPADIARLSDFASGRLLDVDWPVLPGPDVEYNVLDRPTFRDALGAASESETAARRFADGYAFDVSPATDDRPYFGQFLRAGSLAGLLREDRGAWLPVAEWGYLAVVATLVQSGALSLLLLGLPVVALTRSGRREDVRVVRTALYFWAIGFGFIFVELAAIQRLGLVLGHPVLATSATLAALLVCSGLGSALSDRLAKERASGLCALLAVAAVALALASPGAGALVAYPFPVRATVSLAALAIPGLLMGTPFPVGLRLLAPGSAAIAWAWASNGVASVIGASLATLLAMEIGGRGLIVAGAVCYGCAAALAARRAPPPRDDAPVPTPGVS